MYKPQIDQYFAEHTDQMVNDICRLIHIQSDRQPTHAGQPFGAGPAAALAAALDIAAGMGFTTRNYENFVGAIDLNDQPTELDILAHLDVVPGGDGWTVTTPFEPLVLDGRIYGRGTSDDKGPAIAALYAMRAIKDLQIPLRKNVRLILGTDEECGGKDIGYYYQREPEAPLTFTPDAEFPVINIEKGGLRGDFSASWPKEESSPRIISIKGGIKFNVVPAHAEAAIAGLTAGSIAAAIEAASQKTGVIFTAREENNQLLISAKGTSAHAATPHDGNNAITALLELLANLPLHANPSFECVKALNRLFPRGDWAGQALGVAMRDELSGELTLSFNMIELNETGLKGIFDCRAPLCATDENLLHVAAANLLAAGIVLSNKELNPPHHVSAESDFVKTLLSCYEQYSGKPGKCLAIGGGTYVHNLKNGVAFGCADLDVDNHLHGADEFADINQLVMSAKIFTQAIIELCG